MATIDQRIVSAVFENERFERNIAQTMASMKKFNEALANTGKTSAFSNMEKEAAKVTFSGPASALDKFRSALSGIGRGASSGWSTIESAANRMSLHRPIQQLGEVESKARNVGSGASRSFGEIDSAASRVNLRGLNDALGGIGHKFSIIQGAASVALGNIASRAIMTGTQVAKSLTLDPIMAGFHNYETQINAVQTILANTGLTGKKGLDQVNSALANLNKYANLTVYNFSEMARNIGTFTAAGVKLDVAVGSIKGIANLAAMSGSTSQQASSAMYQLSQAIAAGQVHLQDWNSVVNAGIGGKVFQNALIQTGLALGTIEKSAYKVDKATGQATVNGETFRQSIQAKPGQQSWLTSKVLTTALENFTGDMSKAKLEAEGFSAAQIKAIQAQAKTAVNAATQIKTFTQLMEALKEEVGTAWAAVFKTIFGNINQAKTFFSALHTTIENDLTIPIYNFNRLLEGWQKLGGRNTLIEGLKDGARDLIAIFHTLRDAFREVFPATTSRDLYNTTLGFRDLMKSLMPSQSTLEGLRKTFAGVFAVLHIGIAIVKGVVGVIAELIGTVGHGSGGILSFTGSIGDFLVHLDRVLTREGALQRFFHGLADVLKQPLHFIEQLASALFSLFQGVDLSNLTGSMAEVTSTAKPLGRAIAILRDDFDGFIKVVERLKERANPVLDEIANAFGKVGDAIANAFSNQNFSHTAAALQTVFVGGIFLVLRKAILGGVTSFGSALASPLKGINNVLGTLSSNLRAMQRNVNAKTILEIAAAIGILAASVKVLSTINPGRLASSLTAIAVGLGELMGSMSLMTRGLGKTAFLQIPLIAGSLIAMSTAIVILAGAMKIFSTMKWEDIGKGLVGVGGGLAVIGAGMKALGPSTLIQGPALIAIGVALNILALAVKQFASLKWQDLAKGIAGVLGSLIALAAPLDVLGPSLLITGPGLILVSTGMTLLAAAVAAFGNQSVGTLTKGIVGLSVALLAIGTAVQAIPPTVALQAAGLVILSAALTGIAVAVKAFGSMSLGTLAKGLIAMGAAMVVLAAGLSMMTTGLPGAAALLVAAGAFAVLGPAVGFMGQLDWTTIIKGLVAMAGVLGTLAVVGALAAPGLTALGIALLPLAADFIAVAGGIFLFAKALEVMGGAGTKGVAVMVAAITGFVAILPKIVVNFIEGIIDSFDRLADVAPKVLDAIGRMLTSVVHFVIKQAPNFLTAFGALVVMFTRAVTENAPRIISAGIKLLGNFLSGIAGASGMVARRGATIIVRFLNGLTSKAGDLAKAGGRAVVAFVNGIGSVAGRAVTAAIKMAGRFVRGVANGLVGLADVGARAIIRFLNGIADVINRRAPQVRHAGLRVAEAMVNGMLGGFTGFWPKVEAELIKFANKIPKPIRAILKVLSPSRVFHDIGENLGLGLANGIDASSIHAERSSKGMGDKVTKAMKEGLGHIPVALSDMKEFNPKITPILDLSHVKKHAGELGALTSSPTVTPATSNDHAMTILRQLSAAEKARAETELGPGPKHPTSVTFVQHNNSPKSLSTAEIYRRTGNQISKIRNELGLTHGGPAVVMQ